MRTKYTMVAVNTIAGTNPIILNAYGKVSKPIPKKLLTKLKNAARMVEMLESMLYINTCVCCKNLPHVHYYYLLKLHTNVYYQNTPVHKIHINKKVAAPNVCILLVKAQCFIRKPFCTFKSVTNSKKVACIVYTTK